MFLIGSFFAYYEWHRNISSIVFGMAYLVFRSSRSFSSSFGKLIYYDYKILYNRLFFYIDRLVSIVVGRFYVFNFFFFFLRCFGENIVWFYYCRLKVRRPMRHVDSTYFAISNKEFEWVYLFIFFTLNTHIRLKG
jgi:hypothetical protein